MTTKVFWGQTSVLVPTVDTYIDLNSIILFDFEPVLSHEVIIRIIWSLLLHYNIFKVLLGVPCRQFF